jgi:hypothetical protein
MHERDELDLLLDSALSTYGDPGQDTGLEERIVSRIRAEAAPPPRSRWLLWAVPLAIAACLLLLVLSAPKPPRMQAGLAGQSRSLRQSPTITAHTDAYPAGTTEISRSPKAAAPGAPPQPVILSAGPAPLPKLDVFPTPRPVNPAEQALAAQTPAPELQALAGAPEQPDTPLSFASIHIPPLEPPDEGEN